MEKNVTFATKSLWKSKRWETIQESSLVRIMQSSSQIAVLLKNIEKYSSLLSLLKMYFLTKSQFQSFLPSRPSWLLPELEQPALWVVISTVVLIYVTRNNNSFAEGSASHIFKKMMLEMGAPYNKMDLASFMSWNMEECGSMGGYAELVNFDPRGNGDATEFHLSHKPKTSIHKPKPSVHCRRADLPRQDHRHHSQLYHQHHLEQGAPLAWEGSFCGQGAWQSGRRNIKVAISQKLKYF